MRGYSDEMGGPDSIASEAEWGPLSFGDEGMTAAGLPASPGVDDQVWHTPSALPSEKRRPDMADLREWRARMVTGEWVPGSPENPHVTRLRHNALLRRSLTDPGYGASRELSWREKVSAGLGVPSVPEIPCK